MELLNSYAEVAAYKASKWLDQTIVPPTVIKKCNQLVGSLQFFVESPFDLWNKKDRSIACSKLNLKEICDMLLFYFVFGQWDTHPGNQIIAFNDNQAKLALIDNSAISSYMKVRYGDYAFVRWLKSDKVINNIDDTFPFDSYRTLKLPITEEGLEELKEVVTITPKIIKWLSKIKKEYLNYIVWNNAIWFQFHKGSKSATANFTNIYSKATLEKYKSLNLEDLQEIFSDAIANNAKFCTEEYLNSILERRDQILGKIETDNVIFID